jgi:hypothetical protein
MSNNIFAKNKYNEIFKNLNLDSESSYILPKTINIIDLNSSNNIMSQNGGSDTSEFNSSIMPQNEAYLSATSSNTSMFMAQKGGSFNATNGEMTSSFMPQNGGYLSATSSNTSSFMPQKGGSFNATNNEMTSSFMPQKGGFFNTTFVNKNNNDDINQLISMLTSDSNDKNNFTANSTATEELENRLRNMLQDGGAKKNKKY